MLNSKSLIINGAALGAALSVYNTRKRTPAELVAIAANIDAASFGNWFVNNGVSHEAIAAMWLTESLGDPRATNLTGGDGAQGGAWGLGQVTALTSTDYGLIQPLAPLMLFPSIGARVSMSHVQAVVRGLRSNGLTGDVNQWVQAYNVGLTGFINGARNSAHYTRFLTHYT